MNDTVDIYDEVFAVDPDENDGETERQDTVDALIEVAARAHIALSELESAIEQAKAHAKAFSRPVAA